MSKGHESRANTLTLGFEAVGALDEPLRLAHICNSDALSCVQGATHSTQEKDDMDTGSLVMALLGGLLIGVSVTLMLLLHGRVTGITGILVGATFERTSGDWFWRILFLSGLVVGGTLMALILPSGFSSVARGSFWLLAAAGLLVGFGTRLGNGCTSGHGVCGVSRLAPRSLLATGTFMLTGILTVFVVRHVFGGLG